MLSCKLFYLSLKIFMEEASFFIAKEAEKCFEVMKFMNLLSLVNGKLDWNSGLLTSPNKLAMSYGEGLHKNCWSSSSLSFISLGSSPMWWLSSLQFLNFYLWPLSSTLLLHTVIDSYNKSFWVLTQKSGSLDSFIGTKTKLLLICSLHSRQSTE